MSNNIEPVYQEITDLCNYHITHMTRVNITIAKLLGIIAAYHQLSKRFTPQLPNDFLALEIPLLDMEAETLECLSESLVDVSNDNRMIAEALHKAARGE
jgi:hypothetical protein